MAATRITPITPNGPYLNESTSPQMNVITATAADATNGNVIAMEYDLLLVVENTDVGAHNFTVTSQPDPFGRVNTFTQSVAAGTVVTKKFSRVGWADGSGDLNVLAANVAVEILAFAL